MNHYSTSAQFILLIPTKGSWHIGWHIVIYTLLSTQFPRLVLNFTEYSQISEILKWCVEWTNFPAISKDI